MDEILTLHACHDVMIEKSEELARVLLGCWAKHESDLLQRDQGMERRRDRKATVARFIDYMVEGDVARITLAEAERGNPIHHGLVGELGSAVRDAVRSRARVVVLAARDHYFSVGGDLSAFTGAPDLGAFIEDLAESLHRVISDLVRSDAIVICAVQGPATGAGFPLAAAADVVVATRSATFSLGYTRVGLSVDGGTSLLVHTLGLHQTLRLALLNDVLSADQAYELGLVARVVDEGALTDEVDGLVERLRNGPSAALAATKRLLRSAAEVAPESVMRTETLSIARRATEGDSREGISAFLEKRRPRFD